MKPSDEYTYDLLGCSIAVIVKKIMLQVMERSLQIKCCKLSDKYNRKGEYEGSRKIGIYRTKIRSKPLIFRYEDKPVEHKSREVPEEYDDDESSEEPHIVFGDFRVPYE